MRAVTLTIIAFLAGVPSARAFDSVLRTHGGFWNWRQFQTMRYDVIGWPFSRNDGGDIHTVDLETGHLRIDGGRPGATYHLGFDGHNVWIQPASASLNAPPRFYALVPYQFIGMPFVLAEPGVMERDLGNRILDGRLYDVYAFRFPPGTGAPTDTFVAYVDADTSLLYFVTFNAPVTTSSGQPPATFAMVFDEWQTVEGLTVPRRLSIHEWTSQGLGHRRAQFSVENVHFDHAIADPSAFTRPEGAVVDASR